jgi:hypothetical protein
MDVSEQMADAQDLIANGAAAIVELLREGEIQPYDLLDALEQRIAVVDQAVNALPTLCFERARAHADRLMRQPPAERGPLCGLPVPIKDLIDLPAYARPEDRRFMPIMFRRNPIFWSSTSRRMAASSTLCRTRRSSAPVQTPSIPCSVQP